TLRIRAQRGAQRALGFLETRKSDERMSSVQLDRRTCRAELRRMIELAQRSLGTLHAAEQGAEIMASRGVIGAQRERFTKARLRRLQAALISLGGRDDGPGLRVVRIGRR